MVRATNLRPPAVFTRTRTTRRVAVRSHLPLSPASARRRRAFVSARSDGARCRHELATLDSSRREREDLTERRGHLALDILGRDDAPFAGHRRHLHAGDPAWNDQIEGG